MSRESVIFLLGMSMFLMPHLGVPSDWKFYFYTIAGLLCMLCGYTLRRRAYLRSLERGNGERHADSFTEHTGTRETTGSEHRHLTNI